MAEKPAFIKQARVEGRTDILSAAGRKGAKATAELRRKRRDENDMYDQVMSERQALEMDARLAEEGDIDHLV